MSMAPAAETAECLYPAAPGVPLGVERLPGSVYADLFALAERYLQREPSGHLLQATDVVHEAFLRLLNQRNIDVRQRSQFLAIAALTMRRVLVDHARKKHRDKRGGGRRQVSLTDACVMTQGCTEDVLAVDEALRKLADRNARQAVIVELRFFSGLTVAEVAVALGISKRTVESDWQMARAWLHRELGGDATA